MSTQHTGLQIALTTPLEVSRPASTVKASFKNTVSQDYLADAQRLAETHGLKPIQATVQLQFGRDGDKKYTPSGAYIAFAGEVDLPIPLIKACTQQLYKAVNLPDRCHSAEALVKYTL